jgi:hypothetical protein
MFERKRDERLFPMVLLVIAVAVLTFLIVRLVWNIVPSVTTSTPSITTIQTAPEMAVVDVAETFEFIRYNHQATGLTSNQAIYQASLNYADYVIVGYVTDKPAKDMGNLVLPERTVPMDLPPALPTKTESRSPSF